MTSVMVAGRFYGYLAGRFGRVQEAADISSVSSMKNAGQYTWCKPVWTKWLDIELPALQGKTTRQAVRDELGRKQVDALLEEAALNMKNRDGFQGTVNVLLRVRKELGWSVTGFSA